MMKYGVMHQNKAISEQSSDFFCTTDELWNLHQNTALSEQSSELLCNTEELWSYASDQSSFKWSS